MTLSFFLPFATLINFIDQYQTPGNCQSGGSKLLNKIIDIDLCNLERVCLNLKSFIDQTKLNSDNFDSRKMGLFPCICFVQHGKQYSPWNKTKR